MTVTALSVTDVRAVHTVTLAANGVMFEENALNQILNVKIQTGKQ